MRLVRAHAERVGEVPAGKIVAEAQLDDLPVAGVEPGERGAHQRAQLRLLRLRGQVYRVVGHLARLVERHGRRAGTDPAVAFVARDGIKPGPEPAVVAEP